MKTPLTLDANYFLFDGVLEEPSNEVRSDQVSDSNSQAPAKSFRTSRWWASSFLPETLILPKTS